MKIRIKVSARDRARDTAVGNELNARYQHFRETYGEDGALEMLGGAVRVMVALGKGRSHEEVRDMLVDIYNAVAAMLTIAQTFPE